jgi:hypothetical protein
MKIFAALTKYVLLCCVFTLAACSQQPNEQPVSQLSAWDAFVEDYINNYFEQNPHTAVNAGKHEFDGQLPDYSTEGIADQILMLKSFLQQALDFDTAGMESEKLFEREYLISEIEDNLFWLEEARWPYKNPAYYRGALSPAVYISREYAPLEERFAALITFLNNLPAAIDQAQANLSEGPLPETYVQLGIGFFGGLASYFENDVPLIFASVENDSLQSAFAAANAAAFQAASEAAAWLS